MRRTRISVPQLLPGHRCSKVRHLRKLGQDGLILATLLGRGEPPKPGETKYDAEVYQFSQV